jgi:hypothetical protein
MHAPLFPRPARLIPPTRGGSALLQPPPRVWNRLSQSTREQVACLVADMVKRMAAKTTEERGDGGDHDNA